MNMKKVLAAVAAIVMLSTGCGQKTDTAEIEALLTQAKTTMATVESMEADMEMEMDMSLGEEVMETTTVAHIRSQQNPLKIAMEMSMKMSDGTEVDQMQMYAVEEDGRLQTYMNTAETWYAETLQIEDMGQYNAEENMDLYLDNITDFRSEGQEKINGKDATKISGVIKGDAMEAAIEGSGLTASAQSLGISEDMLADIYKDMKDLPVRLWIDAGGYVLKYEIDMTEMMQKIMSESMKALGASEEDMKVKIKKTSITMVCKAFNEVGEIVIPAEALSAPKTEPAPAE